MLPWNLKSVSRIRQDIKNWNEALAMAMSEDPKMWALQLMYNEIMLDALLTSQVENRKQQVLAAGFEIKKGNGEVDEEQTFFLRQLPAYRKLTHAMLDAHYYGYNLVEMELTKEEGNINLEVITIPRTNVVPQLGLFYPDYSEDKNISYRDIPEYGTWVLEFNSGDFGLLNKAVSHVLFKRFAQSCWSELCEIYGIPPRVMKTNTQDKGMLTRAEQMMKDMGAAAWFIIDETENFEWAKGTDTNGDVYKQLINLCSNEISLLVSGAVIGQDTVNGNRSKEESSQNLQNLLVQSDMATLEGYWNSLVIPALIKIGILKGDVYGEYVQAKDLEQLWKFTSGSLQYYTVDPEWLKNTFGVEVTGERQAQQPAGKEQEEKAKPEKSSQSLILADFFG